jgi:hypothetical protein
MQQFDVLHAALILRPSIIKAPAMGVNRENTDERIDLQLQLRRSWRGEMAFPISPLRSNVVGSLVTSGNVEKKPSGLAPPRNLLRPNARSIH